MSGQAGIQDCVCRGGAIKHPRLHCRKVVVVGRRSSKVVAWFVLRLIRAGKQSGWQRSGMQASWIVVHAAIATNTALLTDPVVVLYPTVLPPPPPAHPPLGTARTRRYKHQGKFKTSIKDNNTHQKKHLDSGSPSLATASGRCVQRGCRTVVHPRAPSFHMARWPKMLRYAAWGRTLRKRRTSTRFSRVCVSFLSAVYDHACSLPPVGFYWFMA